MSAKDDRISWGWDEYSTHDAKFGPTPEELFDSEEVNDAAIVTITSR